MSALEAADGVTECVAMGGQVGAADIGELHVLQVLPDAFVGIQVGGVTRQTFQPDPALGLFQDSFDRAAAMDRRWKRCKSVRSNYTP